VPIGKIDGVSIIYAYQIGMRIGVRSRSSLAWVYKSIKTVLKYGTQPPSQSKMGVRKGKE
jgi:hypothetical protein